MQMNNFVFVTCIKEIHNIISFALNLAKQKRYLDNRFKVRSHVLDLSQRINIFISSRTKCHSTCFKMVKKSGRYLLLFEGNKEFKIGSYLSITLQIFYYQVGGSFQGALPTDGISIWLEVCSWIFGFFFTNTLGPSMQG